MGKRVQGEKPSKESEKTSQCFSLSFYGCLLVPRGPDALSWKAKSDSAEHQQNDFFRLFEIN